MSGTIDNPLALKQVRQNFPVQSNTNQITHASQINVEAQQPSASRKGVKCRHGRDSVNLLVLLTLKGQCGFALGHIEAAVHSLTLKKLLQCKTEAHLEVTQATQMAFAGKAGSAAFASKAGSCLLRDLFERYFC